MFEQVKAEADDGALHGDVVRLAARVAEREVSEDEARHAAMLDDVTRRAEDHGGDAVRFEVTGDQTHGLVAHGSERHQDGRIRTVLAAAAQDLRRVALLRSSLAVLGGHTMQPLRQTPDSSCSGELVQPVHRKV